MNKPKIIAVDFDRTLCIGNNWPNIGEPNRRVINYIRHSKHLGAKIILYTCREGKLLDDAIYWCSQHRIEFDAINENIPEVINWMGNNSRKIVADEYIDDKAVNIKEFA